jgi:Amt family ammonium transporter
MEMQECLDTIWMLLAGLLVFFMHAGFSLLEAGSVRFKNTQNILAKNLIVVTVGFLCWYVVGYPFALGATKDPSDFAGFTNFFMDGLWETKTNFGFGSFRAPSAPQEEQL